MSDIEIIKNESGLNLDYDEISPITNNKCVIVEADEETGAEHRMCMESGYVTCTTFTPGSTECEEYESGCSQLMIKLRLVDNTTGTLWYPTYMQIPGVMLYVEGTTPMDYMWSVARIVPIIGEERLKYPVPGKENEYHTTRLDVDAAVKFKGNEFQEALEAFYDFNKNINNED